MDGATKDELMKAVLDFGKFASTKLTHTPLAYVKWMSLQLEDDNKWKRLARLELERRNYTMEDIHFSEHVIERFSQRCRHIWQNRSEVGIITCMKALFLAAMKEGKHEHTGEAGESTNTFHRGLKWTWTVSVTVKGEKVYEVLSIWREFVEEAPKETKGFTMGQVLGHRPGGH